MAPEMHPDDEFHEPTTDDPEWTETCWFTFTVPERGLSGQLYPYFKRNQGVAAGGAFFWDGQHERPETCVYAKQFWHLPLAADARLTDLELANGIRYTCLEPQKQWAIGYDDPDGGDEIHVDLTVTGVVPPNMLGESHVDQACRYQGTIVLHGEEIPVDSYGFRDRSWGPRPQYGQGIHGGGSMRGGYSYATASDRDAFHAITMDFGTGCIAIHGYVLRDGEWAKVKSGTREVVERDEHGFPVLVVLDLVDEQGRELRAEGRLHNSIAFLINPNLFTINGLTEWTFDGVTAWGEDHDNHSFPDARRLFREARGQKLW
jgi:hypothetical protein